MNAGGIGGRSPRPSCDHPPAETLECIWCSVCGAYKPAKEAPLTYVEGNRGGQASNWSAAAGHVAGAFDSSGQGGGTATLRVDGRSLTVSSPEELKDMAARLATAARLAGCRGAIVALSFEKDGHSYFDVRAMGPCLEIEGLASHIPDVLAGLWPKQPTPPPAGVEPCPECKGSGVWHGSGPTPAPSASCKACAGTGKRRP